MSGSSQNLFLIRSTHNILLHKYNLQLIILLNCWNKQAVQTQTRLRPNGWVRHLNIRKLVSNCIHLNVFRVPINHVWTFLNQNSHLQSLLIRWQHHTNLNIRNELALLKAINSHLFTAAWITRYLRPVLVLYIFHKTQLVLQFKWLLQLNHQGSRLNWKRCKLTKWNQNCTHWAYQVARLTNRHRLYCKCQ